MSEVEDVRAALTGPVMDNYRSAMELSARLDALIVEGDKSDVLGLLELIGSPLAVSRGFGSMEEWLILSIVRRFHDLDLLPRLEALEPLVPEVARPQLVRSVLEIAALNDNAAAVQLGLRMADRLGEAQIPLGFPGDPFYWLEQVPVHPDLVLAAIPKLAAHPTLRDRVEHLRLVYAKAHAGAGAPATLLSGDEIRRLMSDDDQRIVTTIVDTVEAILDHAGALAEAALSQVPPVLAHPWAAWWLEMEVLNGGLGQYFWNSSGRYALEAAVALDAMGAPDYAELQRAAVAAFIAAEPDYRRYRVEGTIEAFMASYELRTFDDLDDAFMALYDQRPLSDVITDWLKTRVDELIDALLASR